MINRTNQSGGPQGPGGSEGEGAFDAFQFRTREQARAIEAASQVNHAIDALRSVRSASASMPDLTSAILLRVERSRRLVDAPTHRRHRVVRAACVGLVLGGAGCVSYAVYARPWEVHTPGAIGSVVRGASQDAQSGFANVRRLSSAWVSNASTDSPAGALPAINAPGINVSPATPVFNVLTRQVIGSRDADPIHGVTLSNVLPVSGFFGRESTARASVTTLASGAMISDSSLQRSLGLQAQSLTARVRAAISPLSTSTGASPMTEEVGDAFFTPR